jgi:hypothetical protein
LKEYYRFGGLYLRGNTNGKPVWRWGVNATIAEALYAHFTEQPTTWYWIVGFWEGDGSIWENNYNPATPQVSFSQKTTPSNLVRVRGYLKVGNITGPRSNGEYCLNIYGEDARELTLSLYDDVISPRRKEQLRPFVEAILAHGSYQRARGQAAA